jgi:hypothetical protein
MMAALWRLAPVVALVSTGAVSPAFAQNVGALRSTTALTCTFTVSATPRWAGGEPQVELTRAAFRFQLLDINTDEGSARYADVVERTHVIARLVGSTLHFIDSRLDGSVAVTTVFAPSGRESKFRAAYSRTHYYRYAGPAFESIPEVLQALGFCEPGR